MKKKHSKEVQMDMEDRRTIKMMISGVPYELEYKMDLAIKNLNTKQEAPLDCLAYEDLKGVYDALNDATRELEEAQDAVNDLLELYEQNDFQQSGAEWSTKLGGGVDVDDEAREAGWNGHFAGTARESGMD